MSIHAVERRHRFAMFSARRACGAAESREIADGVEPRILVERWMTVKAAGDDALRPMSEDQFIELVTADQPDAPAYFTYDALNAKERPTLDAVLERVLKPLSLDEVLRLREKARRFWTSESRPRLPMDTLSEPSTSDLEVSTPRGRGHY